MHVSLVAESRSSPVSRPVIDRRAYGLAYGLVEILADLQHAHRSPPRPTAQVRETNWRSQMEGNARETLRRDISVLTP